ncbi:MAG: VPLPA-CTERM sorting domain-containing protein [Mangrovicoccus sp.]
MLQFIKISGLALTSLFFATSASSATYIATAVVSGQSNLWLAGSPSGTTAYASDSAPFQSPVLATPVTGGDILTFSVSGTVSNNGWSYPPSADGGASQYHVAGAENGISDLIAPLNSLIGVFLNEDVPVAGDEATKLVFNTAASLNYSSISPLLNQAFFIGDGMTDGGFLQEIIVPDGAVRLFLGSMDGFNWNNNGGAFNVNITGTTVPLPWAGAALLSGVGVLAGMRRRG